MTTCKELRLKLTELKTLKQEFNLALGNVRVVKDFVVAEDLRSEIRARLDQLSMNIYLFEINDGYEKNKLPEDEYIVEIFEEKAILMQLHRAIRESGSSPRFYKLAREIRDDENKIFVYSLEHDKNTDDDGYDEIAFVAMSSYAAAPSSVIANKIDYNQEDLGKIENRLLLYKFKDGEWQDMTG
jgi:hypothetical protein